MIFGLIFLSVIISFSMIGFGLLFYKKPPRDINAVFGYRTAMSCKNQECWRFAHHYAGRYWFVSGIVAAILSIGVIFLAYNVNITGFIFTIVEITYLIILLSVIPATEIALRKNFNKDGTRKSVEEKVQ